MDENSKLRILVLGYVVLPDQIDLSAELDIYWNDRRITPRFF